MKKISYWQIFRLIFVLFSFYLLGDAIYRWGSYRFFASFSDFLPNLCLVSILWSFIAFLTALLLWLSIKSISLFQLTVKWKNTQRLFLLLFLLVSLGATTFIIKRLIVPDIPIPSHFKAVIYLGGAFAAILLTCAMESYSPSKKNNVIQFLFTFLLLVITVWIGNRILLPGLQITLPWVFLLVFGIALASIYINRLLRNNFEVIQNHITIWVWLFGLFVIVSIPFAGYQTMWIQTVKTASQDRIFSSEADIKRPNIILVTFDSLKTKDMSVYGYHRPTTPYISEWAKEASVFTGMKGASNYTSTAIPSLLTGKRVWTHRVFQPDGFKVDRARAENVVKLLKQYGYYNMAYIVIMPLKIMGFGEPFDIIAPDNSFLKDLNFIGHIDLMLYRFFSDKLSHYNWIIRSDFLFGKLLIFINKDLSIGKKVIRRYDLKKVFNTFIHDLDDNPPEPFFAHLHVAQPHAKGMFGPVSASDNLFKNRDRYNEVIRSCDEQFKDFISNLAKRDKLKNTVIILSSDHGYMFKDNRVGIDLRGYHLDEELTSLPMIIKDYRVQEGHVIDDIVEQIDIPATILDLANIPVPAWMEGRSLTPLMYGEKLTPRRAFSMNFERNKSKEWITKGVIAVWEGDYKLIHYLEEKKSLLFNLKDDPEELNDLFNIRPEIGKRLLEVIHTEFQKANERFKKIM
jgi:arylsulfatase A-like enzyme